MPKPIVLNELLTILQQMLGVEWLFAPAPALSAGPLPPAIDVAAVMPVTYPLSSVALLTTLLTHGQRQLRRQAEALLRQDPTLEPFASELWRLIRAYQIEKLNQWLAALIDTA